MIYEKKKGHPLIFSVLTLLFMWPMQQVKAVLHESVSASGNIVIELGTMGIDIDPITRETEASSDPITSPASPLLWQQTLINNGTLRGKLAYKAEVMIKDQSGNILSSNLEGFAFELKSADGLYQASFDTSGTGGEFQFLSDASSQPTILMAGESLSTELTLFHVTEMVEVRTVEVRITFLIVQDNAIYPTESLLHDQKPISYSISLPAGASSEAPQESAGSEKVIEEAVEPVQEKMEMGKGNPAVSEESIVEDDELPATSEAEPQNSSVNAPTNIESRSITLPGKETEVGENHVFPGEKDEEDEPAPMQDIESELLLPKEASLLPAEKPPIEE